MVKALRFHCGGRQFDLWSGKNQSVNRERERVPEPDFLFPLTCKLKQNLFSKA